MVQPDSQIDSVKVIRQLGGTIKIGKVIARISAEQILTNPFWEKGLSEQDRPIFGISYYGSDRKTRQQVRNLGLQIKKRLKGKGKSSRFVVSKEPVLSSVVVAKNKLIKKGAEFVLLPDNQDIIVGLTEVVQEFEEYSRRDYGRPSRDSRSGMLPPKLAKMMINLAQTKKEALLLDPFCGSGTILQEAILMGYQNLVGSDISKEAISDTKDNLKWLLQEYSLRANYKLIESDSRVIYDQIPKPDSIITEPYLGPSRWQENQLPDIIRELSRLYLGFFRAASQVVASGTPLVVIFPVWRVGTRLLHLPIAKQVEEIGFRAECLAPGKNNSNSIIYERPRQKVLRQIFVWRKR